MSFVNFTQRRRESFWFIVYSFWFFRSDVFYILHFAFIQYLFTVSSAPQRESFQSYFVSLPCPPYVYRRRSASVPSWFKTVVQPGAPWCKGFFNTVPEKNYVLS